MKELHRDYGTWLLGVNVVLFGLAVWHILAPWGGEANRAAIAQCFWIWFPLSLAMFALRTSAQAHLTSVIRSGWRLVALGFFSFFMSQVVWAYYEQILQVPMTPLPVAFLAFAYASYPLAAMGILRFRADISDRIDRVQFWLDALIVTGSVGVMLWYFLVWPLVNEGGASLMQLVAATSYPALDMLLVGAVTTLILAPQNHIPHAGLHWIVVGLVLMCLADTGLAYQNSRGTYATGHAPDLAQFASYLIMMTGLHLVWRAGLSAENTRTSHTAQSYYFSALPYLALILTVGFLIYVNFQSSANLSEVVEVAALILMALLVLRLLFAVLKVRLTTAALRERETAATELAQRLTKISSQLPGVVFQFRMRPDGQLSMPFASQAADDIFRLPPEILAHDVEKAFANIHPEDVDGLRASVAASARDLSQWRHEFRYRYDDGAERWLLGNAVPQREADGSVLWHGFMTDNTAYRQTQQTLEEAKSRAEAANQAKSRFLANMSHEIRTPMNAIMCLTELTLGTQLDQVQHDYVQSLDSASKSLLVILNDVLDFSKIEAGQLTMERLPFDLDKEMATINGLLAVTAKGRGLTFDTVIDADVPRNFMGDAQRIRQILLNLVGNAIKFTSEGSVNVKISMLEKQESQLRARIYFEITDTGIGIDSDQQALLFQEFSQADTSVTRRYGGTGLGLAICKKLVELMRGEIGVRSVPGRGSCFHFTIWLGLASLPDRVPGPGEPAVPSQALEGWRILLVDDVDINRMIARALLKRAGALVTEAGDGQQALDLLETNPQGYDAVLMDVQMPVMDGLTAARRIREHGLLKNLPIIALTADAMVEEKQRCLDAGMNGHLSKPIRMDDLHAALKGHALR
jgi:signal transduction histidine kinase/CheY-like chemotaxis protein